MDPTQNDSFGSFSSGQGGYIGQPGAYSAEPVVLGNDGRKKSKKWVWILVVLLVVGLIIAAVTMLMMSNEKKQKKAAAEKAFYEVANYVMGGEDGDNDSSDLATRYNSLIESYTNNDDLLYAINIREQNFEKIKGYYKELDEKIQVFSKRVQELSEENIADKYIETLKVLRNSIDYYTVRNNLVDSFETSGETSAKRFIQQNISCGSYEWILAPLCDSEEMYYESFLEEYISNNKENDDSQMLLVDILNEDNMVFLNLEIRRTQHDLLEEMKND